MKTLREKPIQKQAQVRTDSLRRILRHFTLRYCRN